MNTHGAGLHNSEVARYGFEVLSGHASALHGEVYTPAAVIQRARYDSININCNAAFSKQLSTRRRLVSLV